jgi:hypothetical protein
VAIYNGRNRSANISLGCVERDIVGRAGECVAVDDSFVWFGGACWLCEHSGAILRTEVAGDGCDRPVIQCWIKSVINLTVSRGARDVRLGGFAIRPFVRMGRRDGGASRLSYRTSWSRRASVYRRIDRGGTGWIQCFCRSFPYGLGGLSPQLTIAQRARRHILIEEHIGYQCCVHGRCGVLECGYLGRVSPCRVAGPALVVICERVDGRKSCGEYSE